jgi:hypothetical protein
LFHHAMWYGKSARKSSRKSNVLSLAKIVNKLFTSPFAGLDLVMRYKSLQLLPFLVAYRLYRLWGYAFD